MRRKLLEITLYLSTDTAPASVGLRSGSVLFFFYIRYELSVKRLYFICCAINQPVYLAGSPETLIEVFRDLEITHVSIIAHLKPVFLAVSEPNAFTYIFNKVIDDILNQDTKNKVISFISNKFGPMNRRR